MKKSILIAATLVGLGSLNAAADTMEFIVKPKASASTFSTKQQAKGYQRVVVDADEVSAEYNALVASGRYESVERNYPTELPKPVRREAVGYVGGVRTLSLFDGPNDPSFSLQWGWNPAIHAIPGAGILRAVQGTKLRKRARIAVIDTGFTEISDVEYSGGYRFDAGFVGGKYTDKIGEEAACSNGHGLSVAAIAAAKTNNGIGIAGVAQADILAVKALNDCGNGTLFEAAQAIAWVAGHPSVNLDAKPGKVDVINLSLGATTTSCPSYLQEVIDFAHNKGIVLVAAAGNDNVDAGTVSPANCNNVIVVGASDQNGRPTEFTNKGETVDLYVPGELIVAPGNGGDLYYWEGTSQAAPLVTGAIALARSEFPNLQVSDIKRLLLESLSFDRFQADVFMDSVRATMAKQSSYIKSALVDGGSCNGDAALFQLPNATELCGWHEVSFEGEKASEDTYYKLHEVPEGVDLTLENSLVLTTSYDTKTMLFNLMWQRKRYGYQVCYEDAGYCEEFIRPLDISQIVPPGPECI